MKQTFAARKRITEDAWSYETELFCQHCHKMNPYWKFFITEEPLDEQFLNEIKDDHYYYDTSLGDIVESIVLLKEKPSQCRLVRSFSDEEKEKINNIKFEYRTKTEILRKCPNCGNPIHKKDIQFLEKSRNWETENAIYSSHKISKEDNKIILSANLFSIFPNTEAEKLKYKKINVRFVFSLIDHNVYAFQPYDADENKPLYKKAKRILNITYLANSDNFLSTFHKIILNNEKVKKDLLKIFDKENKTSYKEFFKDIPIKKIFLKEIVLYFRYGKYSMDTINLISFLTKDSYCPPALAQRRKLVFQNIYKMQYDYSLFQKTLKNKKCPTSKLFKKMATKNPFMIYMYNSLLKMGFKDYNLITNILSNNIFYSFLMQISLKVVDRDINYDDCIMLIYNMIQKKGEIYTKKNIFDYIITHPKIRHQGPTFSILLDTAKMYSQIATAIEEGGDEINPDIYFGNIEYMHETYIRILPKLKARNRKIPYKKETLKLNSTFGEYEFICAPDTRSLIECGELMGICVGGYGDVAVNRQCIIVFMLKNKQYVGCIELLRDGKTMVQAKAKYNNLLQEEKAEILRVWVTKYNLIVDTCHDYAHILNNDISFDDEKNYQHHYNYAAVKLDNPDIENNNINIDQNYYIIP